MTPEERALMTAGNLPRTRLTIEDFNVFAAAFRQAEANALEEAATIADRYRGVGKRIAVDIRALRDGMKINCLPPEKKAR